MMHEDPYSTHYDSSKDYELERPKLEVIPDKDVKEDADQPGHAGVRQLTGAEVAKLWRNISESERSPFER